MGTKVFGFCFVALVVACGCGGDSETCAPAGTYKGTAVRSTTDPGDCPLDLQMSEIGWKVKDITAEANKTCGAGFDELSGTAGSNCSHKGTAAVAATSTGITGTARFTVDCPRVGAANCTANFDLTWTLQ